MRNKFDKQLETLHVELIKMGALCEDAISGTVDALEDNNDEIVQKVFHIESEIDQKERDIEALCMKLLLQQQPVATDLRVVSAAMKMISDMERIGDQAADIAEITRFLQLAPLRKVVPVDKMANAAMIYIVEDDSSIKEFVAYTLKMAGFETNTFSNGEEFFIALSNSNQPELILLDIMLPGEDGITILKKIRNSSKTRSIPVIMMTAKGTEYDKVLGLDNGADDYITKPFGMLELISRIKAVLRRTSDNPSDYELHAGDITVNPGKHRVMVNGENVILTYKEFEMLCMLIESKGLVLSRNKLLESIWGYDFDGETRTVDVHIRGESGNIIETVRGVGYKIGADYET